VTSPRRPAVRRVASLLLAAATAAGLVAAPLAGAEDAAAVDIAHLRMRVVTTSDWTQVHLGPGTLQAMRVVGRSGDATYRATGDGLSLSRVVGSASVTVDFVFSDLGVSPSYTVRTWKGYRGRTVVTLTNLNPDTPLAVGSYVDEVHSLTDGRNSKSVAVAHDSLMSTRAMRMPHADNRRLVLAFYYPWFANYDSTVLADRPSEPRSVWNGDDVADMTRQAANHGVDGFVVSYAGDENDGRALDLAVGAAQRNDQLVTGYIETPRATSLTSHGKPDMKVVLRWLTQLLQRRTSPAFLRAADGRPVVFVYGMSQLSARSWRMITDNLRSVAGGPVHLVGDSLGWDYLPFEYGVHRYDVVESSAKLTRWSKTTALLARAWTVVDPSIAPRLFVGTVSPGFDDTRLRGDRHPVVERGDGTRYDRTWDAARAGRPDWIVVTSWNEWYEDTQIEPGVDTGRTALDQTLTQATDFAGSR
jgi:hypothetical protein